MQIASNRDVRPRDFGLAESSFAAARPLAKLQLLPALFLLVGGACTAAELGTCRDPVGRAYYHYAGAAEKANTGWTDDKITGAAFTLTQAADSSFDVVYVDVSRKPISSRQEGATIVTLRKGRDTVVVLVAYESSGTDLYSFYRETGGASRFTLMQNRTGPNAPFPKSSVMSGSCDAIRFDLIQ